MQPTHNTPSDKIRAQSVERPNKPLLALGQTVRAAITAQLWFGRILCRAEMSDISGSGTSRAGPIDGFAPVPMTAPRPVGRPYRPTRTAPRRDRVIVSKLGQPEAVRGVVR